LIRESYGGLEIYVRPVDSPTALYPDPAWRVACKSTKSELTMLPWLVECGSQLRCVNE
jgi:hypothetical protein